MAHPMTAAGGDAVVVRPATPDDVEPLAAVQVRAWQAAYPGIMPQAFLDGLDVGRRAAMWRDVLGALDVGRQVLVAVADGPADDPADDPADGPAGGVLTGFAAFGPARDGAGTAGLGELYALNVDPSRWRIGIGSVLIGRVHAGLRAYGHGEAVLWVATGNDRARRFYERHGWYAEPVTQVVTDAFVGGELAETRYRRRLSTGHGGGVAP